MRNFADLRRVRGFSLTEAFFELTRLRILEVWQELARMGYGVRDYFDFTDKRWRSLPIELQIRHASEYQNWYATRMEQRMERSFNGIKFRLIPPGKYRRVYLDWEGGRYIFDKQKKIFIKDPFWCGKYEVTQKEWTAVHGGNPSHFRGRNRPVEQVDWYDCRSYCREMGFKLLHEKQWEYACRGGTTTTYSFGDDSALLEDYAYYEDNSDHETHPVGEKLPNSWKLYDMHGNVNEWTNSFSNSVNGNRLYCSGDWHAPVFNCRSAIRGYMGMHYASGIVGFRVCKEI